MKKHARRAAEPVRSQRRAGLTMVELMVAISILLFAVAGAVASQVASQRLADTGAETSASMADLQACMEQVLLQPVETIPVAGSAFAANQPVAAFEGLHLTDERIVATYPGYVVGGTVPDPLEIVLTSTWRDHGGRTRTLRLACMKTR